MRKFKHLAGSSMSVLALALILPSAVYAQTDDQEAAEDNIIVTGTRIQRQDFISSSPLATTDIEFVNKSGRTTVEDYLKDLPQFAPGTGDYSNDSNGGTAGRATLNLRNLGAKRNLVIMDGRRLMSSGTDGAIDINTIPVQAIGSIETITGGASATYGSDALAGVVNFKTRKDLDGLEVVGQVTSLDESGEDSYKVGVAYGTEYAEGRGNLLITGEYNDRGGVNYFERDFFNVNPQNSTFIVYGHTRQGGSLFTVDDNGNFFDAANVSTTAQPGFIDSLELPLLVNGNDDLRTHGQYRNYIQVPLEQATFFGNTDYEFENGITGYAQGLYASSTAFNIGAEPVSAGIWGVIVPQDNFYLQEHPEIANRIGPAGITNYQTRFQQAGNRTYNTENDVIQVLGGFRGASNTRDLNWDVHLSYGQTKTTDRTISGSVSFAAVQEILDTTGTMSSATPGESPLCAGGFDPFGGTDPFSPDCLDYVSRTPVNETTLEQLLLEGVMEGKLIDMPAGEARFALTAHFRENTYEFNPDDEIARGELANLASSAFTTGSVQVAEQAAEVFLPLFNIPGTDNAFNLTLGLRNSHYNPSGPAWTYKAEFDGRLTDNVLVRGGFQHAVRAPNVEEFFRASLLRVQPFLDVCSSRFRNHVNVTEETNLCTVQGVTPTTPYTQGGSSAPTVTNGNRDLIEETADTLTFGTVFDFDIGEGRVQFSADYYDIKVEDAIEVLSAQQIFTKCFNLDGISNPTYDNSYFPCQQITRTNNGEQLAPVNQPILNLGGIETSGFDFSTSFTMPVDALAWGGGDGSIRINSLVNIQNEYKIQAFSDEPFVDFGGTVSTTTANPELKAFNSITVETGPVSIIGTWRHIAAMDDITAAGGQTTTIDGAPAYDYFDATARVTFMEDFELYAGVNNLTNEEPPQIGGEAVGSTFSGTNQGVYDAIGRQYFFGMRAKF